MNFITFKEQFKNFSIFSVNDIRMIDPGFFNQRLVEWQKKGYIKKIIRKFYIFSDTEINEQLLFLIANKIYKPSYISFETALAYYGLIPESVYKISSASTNKTSVFNTSTGKFFYTTVHKKLFFGYKLIDYKKENFVIATAEKALLDFFYINSHIKTKNDILELRINEGVSKDVIKIPVLDEYLDRFQNKTLERKIKIFKEYIKNA
ncbi:MAG: hypothetical protein A2297_07510 [Elusimicrobia bacterium RIFOXYB2_FULL_48_7]|nr:MAG: hypothetical protein A2297_07510 [Elusimicrobia bacterium RIFOXYB2_FULL_48_7]